MPGRFPPPRGGSILGLLVGAAALVAALAAAQAPPEPPPPAGAGGDIISVLEGACSEPWRPAGEVVRAVRALVRMHQGEAAVRCWACEALSRAGEPGLAAAECAVALSLAPDEPCALYCAAHFALWGVDWTLLEDGGVAERAARAAVGELAGGGVPQIAYLEALLLLPTPRLYELLGRRALLLLGSDSSRAPFPPPRASAGSTVLAVSVLCASGGDHPHGRALLAALEGIARRRRATAGRVGRGVLVTCVATAGEWA
eukprot:CAMPEP_0174921728 /NCGR_PEP_ID=MMETSP1355-20121228/5367_1 /TAXON_ID=464990 /ORGANISM="Hemiselmis tepida, Strain CCMP443" /LENGTH=256 /DNA_ID=CAMNT_0016167249 /DNA_START=267 /DNA_END=1034 /DNA_ORIENTATION=-